MVFNSLTFVVFFTIVVTLYWSLHGWELRKNLLVVASYIFYGAWNPPFAALLFSTTCMDFWLGRQATGEGFRESHLAFTAPDRAAVHAFFEAATARGAEVLHRPRVWPEYHASYYGAFVRDPDGNNVEAVCHQPG